MAETRITEQLPGPAYHAMAQAEVLRRLQSSPHGLDHAEAAARLQRHGRNRLPRAQPASLPRVFARQFASPLIYVLLVAAAVSLLIGEVSDAGFIAAVLLLNALIGTGQEYSAQRAADALQRLGHTRARVLRGGDSHIVDAEELVPGDIVLLESGNRVPADMRLLNSYDMEVDESLLTGESETVLKQAEAHVPPDAVLAERANMVYAGTLVSRGRGQGVVTATGLATELGNIAAAVLSQELSRPPLVVRMERFTHNIALLVGAATLLLSGVALWQGMPLHEIFLLAVALAVSVIPEGLPVALTVALAIGMRRMARRQVIVRRLVAVEALGSCTYIATDKTGTLTVNQLTCRRIVVAGSKPWEVTGESIEPSGSIVDERGGLTPAAQDVLERLCLAAVLANEGFLAQRDSQWTAQGDAVDVALLVMAHKAGMVQAETLGRFPQVAAIPFESEHLFAASLNRMDDACHAFVKGALEKVLPMCERMATEKGSRPLDSGEVERQALALAQQGYRVIALASGPVAWHEGEMFSPQHLQGLELLGLVGLIDPLRREAKAAIARCRQAGIQVGMVTGDHPATALAIARELDLATDTSQVVTGSQLHQASEAGHLRELIRRARVFARVEPRQKLHIVHSLQHSGHFVAVSGDGANDAPALRAAEVGVAMGRSGTDVAKESADIIITDDNFASIVAGVEEGRIAYDNIRKVIFLLISTGAAELVLFVLALLSGQPLPLLAVQLLWLNLVTNGIQDIALAFEPAEGDELRRPPRSPREAIFDRLMIERVLLSALVIGVTAFALFSSLLAAGLSLEAARNTTLLLMVLFENVHVFNCRSETRSVFQMRFWNNPVLLLGTLAAQFVHIGAMYMPGLNEVLQIQPVAFSQWLELLGLALILLLIMELHKWVWRKRKNRK